MVAEECFYAQVTQGSPLNCDGGPGHDLKSQSGALVHFTQNDEVFCDSPRDAVFSNHSSCPQSAMCHYEDFSETPLDSSTDFFELASVIAPPVQYLNDSEFNWTGREMVGGAVPGGANGTQQDPISPFSIPHGTPHHTIPPTTLKIIQFRRKRTKLPHLRQG